MNDEKVWYEQVPSLRRALMLLKPLPDESRELIAKQVIDFARSLSLTQGTKNDHVGYDKVRAMMQTKLAAQAFSNDPYLLKALNETYNLDGEGRHQVGLKMLLCVQAIDNYHKDPSQAALSGPQARIALHNIVQSVFNHEMQQFEAQGEAKRHERVELQHYQEEEARLLARPLGDDDFAGLDEIFVGPPAVPSVPTTKPPLLSCGMEPKEALDTSDVQAEATRFVQEESLFASIQPPAQVEVRFVGRDLKLSVVVPA